MPEKDSEDSFYYLNAYQDDINGTWVQAVSRWVTSVYGKPTVPKLPRTGY